MLEIYISVIVILSLISMLATASSNKYYNILKKADILIGLLILLWPLIAAILLLIGACVIVIIPSYISVIWKH